MMIFRNDFFQFNSIYFTDYQEDKHTKTIYLLDIHAQKGANKQTKTTLSVYLLCRVYKKKISMNFIPIIKDSCLL